MLTITDGDALARALDFPLEPRLAALLVQRYAQLGGMLEDARLIVIQPGDSPAWVEDALGWSIFRNAGDGTRYGDPNYSPSFEWIEDHGFCFELAFQFTDDFTHAVFVENAPRMHRCFLQFCARYASEKA